MIFLLIIGINACGGIEAVILKLSSIDPKLIEIFPYGLHYSIFIYFFSVAVNGFGVIGQPHVMVRVMLIKELKKIHLVRNIYIAWYFLFSLITVGVGLVARALLPELINQDVGAAFPSLVNLLMPDILIGFMLAGVFAAALSTADSQIISCNACITQDLFTNLKSSYKSSKIVTLGVASFATIIAIIANTTVYEMVEIAWSSLAVSIGVLLLLRCIGKKMSNITGILMMSLGIMTVFVWKYYFNLELIIHEVFIGALVSLSIYFISNRMCKNTITSSST